MKRHLRRALGTLFRLGIRLAGKVFVRGSRLADAVRACRRFARRGWTSCLGYFNGEAETPRAVASACLASLDQLAQEGQQERQQEGQQEGQQERRKGRGAHDTYLSIKAPALAFDDALIGDVVDRAGRAGIGVHFDSHGADMADATFAAIATALRRSSPPRPGPPVATSGDAAGWRFGCTLPGRWPRSLLDVDRAAAMGLRVRVVKGQWADPAFPTVDMRDGFLAVVDRLAGRVGSVGVATHDPPLVREAVRRLRRAGTPCELELLLGLPMQGALRVAREVGVGVRIYVPYGVSWVPYALSQVQKNPRLAWWALRDATIGRLLTGAALRLDAPE